MVWRLMALAFSRNCSHSSRPYAILSRLVRTAQKVASCHLAYVWFFKNAFAAILCPVLIILLLKFELHV